MPGPPNRVPPQRATSNEAETLAVPLVSARISDKNRSTAISIAAAPTGMSGIRDRVSNSAEKPLPVTPAAALDVTSMTARWAAIRAGDNATPTDLIPYSVATT